MCELLDFKGSIIFIKKHYAKLVIACIHILLILITNDYHLFVRYIQLMYLSSTRGTCNM